MVNSMTGFASLKGEAHGWTWAWDMRSVNARGLDIRLRLPDWLEGFEQPVRAAVSKVATRGSISLGLRLTRTENTSGDGVDTEALSRVFDHLRAVEAEADRAGVTLVSATALDVLGFRGVLTAQMADEDSAPLVKVLLAQLPKLLDAFQAMRQTEGNALHKVIDAQLQRISDLTSSAAKLAEDRKDGWSLRLKENLGRVLENSDGADPDRIAQEVAVIIVKSDVTEEIDRLHAHVGAARTLLESKDAIGRKLDFLSQEFNREANTLCSKAQSGELTTVGLDLKATIDQMREQVQNVE